jgi:nitrogen regulatory protein PII
LQLITAIVHLSKVDSICDALQSFGFRGLTVTEVAGFGKRRGRVEVYRGTRFLTAFQQKAKIEIVTSEDEVADMIDVICRVAAGGRTGADAGKIWVTPVTEFVRMSTKETGADAR